MDSGFGACLLKDPRVASVVREVWLNRHMHEYLLHAWVIMPNHVHVLIDVAPSTRLCTILEAWKSVSARRINAVLARSGQLWQKESWDRYIRNAVHYERAVSYIYENPVKAGLVERSEDWRWSSWGEGMLA